MELKNQQIIDMYNQGSTYLKIQKIMRVSPKTIQKILYSNNVSIRKKKPYAITITYFDKIDSHEKAYWLGLIMADGCVRHNRDGTKVSLLNISLQERDGYILEKFKAQIGFEGPIGTRIEKRENRQNCNTINICNESFVSKLVKFGITPRKSITHSFFKQIPEKFLKSAILGYFDGDGSVSFLKKENRLCSSIISSIEFSEELGKFLLNNGIKNSCQIRITKLGTRMGSVNIKGNCQCLRLYHLLYSECKVFLKRKKDKFEYVIQEQNAGRIKNTNFLT